MKNKNISDFSTFIKEEQSYASTFGGHSNLKIDEEYVKSIIIDTEDFEVSEGHGMWDKIKVLYKDIHVGWINLNEYTYNVYPIKPNGGSYKWESVEKYIEHIQRIDNTI